MANHLSAVTDGSNHRLMAAGGKETPRYMFDVALIGVWEGEARGVKEPRYGNPSQGLLCHCAIHYNCCNDKMQEVNEADASLENCMVEELISNGF